MSYKRAEHSYGSAIFESDLADALKIVETKLNKNIVPDTTILTSFDPSYAGTRFSIQSVGKDDKLYTKTYSFQSMASPLGNGSTGVVNNGGGVNMYTTGSDRDHAVLWYNGDMYIFATFSAFVYLPNAKIIVYKLNQKTNNIAFHSLLEIKVSVISNVARTTYADPRVCWRPNSFIQDGVVKVAATLFYDSASVLIPMHFCIGTLNHDLTQVVTWTFLNDEIYGGAAHANGSNVLSAKYIDQHPIIGRDGTLKGFLIKDEIFERPKRTEGAQAQWNRCILAGPDGKFIKNIDSLNSLREPDGSQIQLNIEGICVQENEDGTWSAWMQSVISYRIYSCQLTSTFEYVPDSVKRVITPFQGMGAICKVPYIPDLVSGAAPAVTPIINLAKPITWSILSTTSAISLSWSAVSGANSYVIYSGIMPNTGTEYLTTTGNTTIYTHSDLSAGTGYNYRIAASDGTNNSETTVDIPAYTKPAAPANLEISNNTMGGYLQDVNFTWDAVTGTNITYVVQYGLAAGTLSAPIVVSTNDIFLEYLTVGASYRFRVWAKTPNSEGASTDLVETVTSTPI